MDFHSDSLIANAIHGVYAPHSGREKCNSSSEKSPKDSSVFVFISPRSFPLRKFKGSFRAYSFVALVSIGSTRNRFDVVFYLFRRQHFLPQES